MDQRFAMLASLLANIHRGEDQAPYEIWQFMPLDEKERKRRTEEKEKSEDIANQKALSRAMFAAFGPPKGPDGKPLSGDALKAALT